MQITNLKDKKLPKDREVKAPYHISELLGPAAERIERLRATFEARLVESDHNK